MAKTLLLELLRLDGSGLGLQADASAAPDQASPCDLGDRSRKGVVARKWRFDQIA